jgi:hypothetical protein
MLHPTLLLALLPDHFTYTHAHRGSCTALLLDVSKWMGAPGARDFNYFTSHKLDVQAETDVVVSLPALVHVSSCFIARAPAFWWRIAASRKFPPRRWFKSLSLLPHRCVTLFFFSSVLLFRV